MDTVTTRKSARAILALIALATDLPMPNNIRFYTERSTISLDFESIADALPWCGYLDFDPETYLNGDGNRYLKWARGDWHGWNVQLHAYDKPPFDAIEEFDSAALAELAAGR